MSGNMYQLRHPNKIPIGGYFFVDGPFDAHGYVLQHIHTNEKGTLHLIRGTGTKDRRNKK